MNHKALTKMAIASIAGTSLIGMTVTAFSASPQSDISSPVDANDIVHNCAGLNECKGLGGCKVTKEKLAKLAKKKGISADKAGSAHSCAGLNECKGLGGCKVTKGKLKKLKAKQKKMK